MKWWKAFLVALLLAVLTACVVPQEPAVTESPPPATEPTEPALLRLASQLPGSFVCLQGRGD